MSAPDSVKALADARMDARAAKMEEQAPWLALAQAGFKMASQRPEYGKGQSALADISEGAGVGRGHAGMRPGNHARRRGCGAPRPAPESRHHARA